MKNNILKLYDHYIPFRFVERENRFIVLLKDEASKIVKAYLPNPGRMEEYLIPGLIYYAVKTTTKIPLKVVSVLYNNEYVLLEPARANDIYAEFLNKKIIKNEILSFCREKKFMNSRFDFLIKEMRGETITEVKSCTRFNSGLAMFPDAPSERALKHLNELSSLAGKNINVEMVYLVFSAKAKSFVPDYHTDYTYACSFNDLKAINKKVYSVTLIDPVSVDLEKFNQIPVNTYLLENELEDKGCYLLLLKNDKMLSVKTGALGLVDYQKGYYLYIGKAMNNLTKRVARLDRKSRKKHWHIDYVTSHMKIIKRFFVRRNKDIEVDMVRAFLKTSDSYIPDFGSSDSSEPSHFLYYKDNPLQTKDLFSLVMKFRTEPIEDES